MKFSKLFLFVAIIGVVAISMMTSCSSDVSKTKMGASALDSASYSFGILVGNRFFPKEFYEELNVELLARGIIDARDSNMLLEVELANQVVQDYNTKLQKDKEGKNVEEGTAFLAKMAAKPNVKKTPSGLLYEVVQEGNGPKPAAIDTVVTNYHGTLINGETFDKNDGIKFKLTNVIPGWTEGIQLMSVGSKYKFYIPSSLAYGERGTQGIEPHSTLIFEVELLDIIKGDEAAPPAGN